MLEVITRGESSRQHPHALMLVHGAWHGAWCWEGNLLEHFAHRGFWVIALSLRGHGVAAQPTGWQRHSIADYVGDVVEVAAQLALPPVLIGHSMGGFVVQKYLETRDVPAAVLLAATPPRGHLRSLVRIARSHPIRSLKFSLSGQPRHLVGRVRDAREPFFGSDVAHDVVDAVTARLHPDSIRAIYFDMVAGDLVDTSRITTPTLVIGGEQDSIYRSTELHRTARAYGGDPVVIPDTGHELMLEPSWPATAGVIERWLLQRGL